MLAGILKLAKETWEDLRVASPPLRHKIHYAWNQSPANKDYNPWFSACSCCCSGCGN